MKRVKLSRLELQSRINGWFRRHKDGQISVVGIHDQHGSNLPLNAAIMVLQKAFQPYTIQIHEPSEIKYQLTISVWEQR